MGELSAPPSASASASSGNPGSKYIDFALFVEKKAREEIIDLANIYLNEARIHLTKDDLKEAVMQGAGMRLRPIMMTVLATIIGLVPIMYGSGTGSDVMQRIAGPMIGGMTSTLVLTLLVLPAIFYVWKSRDLKPLDNS